MGSLYDNYRGARSSVQQVPQSSSHIPQVAERMRSDMMQRYEKVALAIPELSNMAKSIPFIKGVDEENYRAIVEEVDAKRKEWGERQDLENMTMEVSQFAQGLTNKVKGMGMNAQALAKYQESLTDPKLGLTQLEIDAKIKKSKAAFANAGGSKINEYGQTNQFSGERAVKHLDNNKMVRKTLAGMVPNSDESTLTQDGQGGFKIMANGKIVTISGEDADKTIKNAFNADRNWQESVAQEVDAATYLETENFDQMEDAQITDFVGKQSTQYQKMVEDQLAKGTPLRSAVRNTQYAFNDNKMMSNIYNYGRSRTYAKTSDNYSREADWQTQTNYKREQDIIDEANRWKRNTAREDEKEAKANDFLHGPSGLIANTEFKNIENLRKDGIEKLSTDVNQREGKISELEEKIANAKPGYAKAQLQAQLYRERQLLTDNKKSLEKYNSLYDQAKMNAALELGYDDYGNTIKTNTEELAKIASSNLKNGLTIKGDDGKSATISPEDLAKAIAEGRATKVAGFERGAPNSSDYVGIYKIPINGKMYTVDFKHRPNREFQTMKKLFKTYKETDAYKINQKALELGNTVLSNSEMMGGVSKEENAKIAPFVAQGVWRGGATSKAPDVSNIDPDKTQVVQVSDEGTGVVGVNLYDKEGESLGRHYYDLSGTSVNYIVGKRNLNNNDENYQAIGQKQVMEIGLKYPELRSNSRISKINNKPIIIEANGVEKQVTLIVDVNNNQFYYTDDRGGLVKDIKTNQPYIFDLSLIQEHVKDLEVENSK